MTSDSTVQVLLPLALDGAYTYAVPEGMALAEGDYVRVPLGPRQMTAWSGWVKKPMDNICTPWLSTGFILDL